MYLILRNAAVLDASLPEPREGYDVVVENDRIREVAPGPIKAPGATVFDLAGRTLMPGLIDCHVHVTATLLDLGANARLSHTLLAYQAMPILAGMLERGFTTVRDVGGADHGLAVAIETGLIPGPRLFIAGRALSQTGGHADFRGRWDEREAEGCACCRRLGVLGRVVDGVDDCRRAVRQEIKAGARQIKIMASGGIASPTDPIHFLGFSMPELRAIVEEAAAAGTYVCAHAYTATSIRRAVEAGIRSIEHGNLVDADTAALMAEHGCFVVPTLVTYDALAEEGAALGFPPDSVAKIETVRSAGLASLELFQAAGVTMAYGSDLLGPLHVRQSDEFALRARVLSNFEVICQATANGASVLQMDGELGVIRAGALADLLIVDGNPLADIDLLRHQGRHLSAIMKGGHFVKNRLH